MTLYYEYEPNEFEVWWGQPVNGISHPMDIRTMWSPEELEAIGLYTPLPAAAVPAGKQVVDTKVKRVSGKVKFVNTLENIPPNPVPARISPLQARKALRQLGWKEGVDAYIATLPEEQREEWEYATEIWRNNAVIEAGIAAGVLGSSQVDQIFILGETL